MDWPSLCGQYKLGGQLGSKAAQVAFIHHQKSTKSLIYTATKKRYTVYNETKEALLYETDFP